MTDEHLTNLLRSALPPTDDGVAALRAYMAGIVVPTATLIIIPAVYAYNRFY